MKIWIIGLLLLGIAIPLITSQGVKDKDDDYEVKRFHVQSRELNGKSTCVVTRRKRSTQQSNDEDEESLGGSQISVGGDDEEDLMDQDMQMGISTGDASQDTTGLLIRDTDLAGNAGILVIQNGASPNTPVLFELRPVLKGPTETYFEIGDENNPDNEDDQDFEDESDEMEGNDNRYSPNSNLDSDEYEESPPMRKRVKPTPKPKRKPSNQVANSDEDTVKRKKKPKRPSTPPPKNQGKPNRRKNQNQNNKKKRNQNKKRNGNQNRVSSSVRRKQSNIRKKNLKNRVNSNINRNNRLGVNINKGSGSRTITNTVTTTQTGTANDAQDINCIIINKAPTPTTERPFWDVFGRNAGNGEEDRSFGFRKRFKQFGFKKAV